MYSDISEPDIRCNTFDLMQDVNIVSITDTTFQYNLAHKNSSMCAELSYRVGVMVNGIYRTQFSLTQDMVFRTAYRIGIMKVVVVSASPRTNGRTQIPMRYVYEHIRGSEPDTEFINLAEGGIECYRGYGIQYNETTTRATQLLTEADVWIIGTPIYNSFFSGALKNLFEYVNYKTTAGKVAGMAILAAGNIGFIDVQTLLTQLMSYFRVITNPEAVYMTVDDISDDGPLPSIASRLRKMADTTLHMASELRHDM